MKRIILILLPLIVFAQVQYSGSISPKYLMRISDRSEISLPFRLAELQLGYSIGDFELKTNTALEARWQGTEAEIDLHEVYLVWYPSFGEVKLGKMIHTWGAADGNNPTDNINPYDFYYMFLTGADRKIGVLSGSVKAYWKNLNAEVIVVPEHTPNRLPFGEDDFPIQFPFEPNEYAEIENPLEFGARIQGAFNWGDASISYINGYDRGFSLLGARPWSSSMIDLLEFGYRKTEMVGADLVSFISDFTTRIEVGYFATSNEYCDGQCIAKWESSAEYLQYVIQLEYSGLADINIGIQLLGTYINKTDGEILTMQGVIPLTKENFTPGMGTPFAMIAEKALIVNGSTNIYDDRIELSLMSLINLKETGFLFGVNADYSPYENWIFKIGFNKFIGDSSYPLNKFSQMEDFSHVSLGLEYNF